VIISIGYRVKSHRGTQFRIWATERLREYIIKGFAMDDDRLKRVGGGNYFDERNHVEKPLLDQLDGLDWEIIDLDNKQHPADSHRDSFTEVVMLPVLHEQLKVINPWVEAGWLID
jgi:hypothetical protein